MNRWLFKEEPEIYSFADLQRDGRTLWSGVTNSQARGYLRQIRAGDRILFYHTGREKQIVGEMCACADSHLDPGSEDPKAVIVEVAPVRVLEAPVSLVQVKADPLLKNWELARLPRLSVMPITEEQWQRVEELSRQRG